MPAKCSIAAAVALETLKIYEEMDLVGHVGRLVPRFRQGFETAAARRFVGEARSVGLIGAIELVADRAARTAFPSSMKAGARLARFAQEEGLIVRAMGDAVALCPPLVITPEELDELFARLERALDRFEASLDV